MRELGHEDFVEAARIIKQENPPFGMTKLLAYLDKKKKFLELRERAEVGTELDKTKFVVSALCMNY